MPTRSALRAGTLVYGGCAIGAAALSGGACSFDGSQASGFGVEYGSGWGNGDSFGLSGNGRAYLVENWQVGDWGDASFHRFNLLGKTFRYTVDLSQVGCGVIATLYLAAMGNPSPGSPNYCDINPEAGGCFELDLMEANSRGYEVSLHTRQGREFDGNCNIMGCSTNLGRYPFTVEPPHTSTSELYGPGARVIDSNFPFEVVTSMDETGTFTVDLEQNGEVLQVYNKTAAWNFDTLADPNNKDSYPTASGIPDYEFETTIVPAMQGGLTLVTSLWSGDSGWLDGHGCGENGGGDLGGASFSVSNLSVSELTKASPTATDAPSKEPPLGLLESTAAPATTEESTTAAATTAQPSSGGFPNPFASIAGLLWQGGGAPEEPVEEATAAPVPSTTEQAPALIPVAVEHDTEPVHQVHTPCYRDDIDYNRHDISDTTASSAKECQELCQLEKQCEFFTYAPGNGQCWLKSSDVGEMKLADRIAGPKRCEAAQAQYTKTAVLKRFGVEDLQQSLSPLGATIAGVRSPIPIFAALVSLGLLGLLARRAAGRPSGGAVDQQDADAPLVTSEALVGPGQEEDE